jgi:Flp pilus assembly protein TadG
MTKMSKSDLKFGWLRFLHSSQTGSALIEVALTLPLMGALLLGSVELGGLAYRATEMTSAARSAAQYAAMNSGNFTDCNGTFVGGTCDQASGIYKSAQLDAPWAASTCSNWSVAATSSCTCSGNALACGGGSSGPYSCSSGKPVVAVTIQTSARCGGFASVPSLFNGGFTLSGSAQQEVLQ